MSSVFFSRPHLPPSITHPIASSSRLPSLPLPRRRAAVVVQSRSARSVPARRPTKGNYGEQMIPRGSPESLARIRAHLDAENIRRLEALDRVRHHYRPPPAHRAINPSRPQVSDLPIGYTFYPNHRDLPVPPADPFQKVYVSKIPAPSIPRMSSFHYLFPPKQKGRPRRHYQPPDPHSLAFVDGLTGHKLYREEIPIQAAWASNGLRSTGVKRHDVVCIFGPNSLEWIGANFAILAMEAIVSPVNASYKAHELLHQLVDSNAKAIFVAPALLPVLEEALAQAPEGYGISPSRIILLCRPEQMPVDTPYYCLEQMWRKAAGTRRFVGEEENITGYLCYSSGTTGKAKGVETSHHNMTTQLQLLSTVYHKLYPSDRILGVLPFSHIYGLTLLTHFPLLTGTPVVILPKWDEVQVLDAIQKYKITWGIMVPPMMISLLNSEHFRKFDLTSLKGVQTGAAPCSVDLIKAFESRFPTKRQVPQFGIPEQAIPTCRVTQGYGLTETTPVTHVMTLPEGIRHPGSIGQIAPTLHARLVHPETGKDVAVGEPGELWVRGASVMKGYWKNQEATLDAFAPGGWFKTGDIATVDSDGYFYIVDRLKELIKYKGYQVPPADLEATLLTHPRIADAGVIGIYSPTQATELPRAYIVPKGGLDAFSPREISALEAEVAQWVDSRVANHKRLRGGVVCVPAIPKSPSGKILRKDLRERARAELGDEAIAALGTRQPTTTSTSQPPPAPETTNTDAPDAQS